MLQARRGEKRRKKMIVGKFGSMYVKDDRGKNGGRMWRSKRRL